MNMEDETLYIDADEEITSVIDKMKAAEATTILLVVPKGASLLQSIVNLKLLKKEADEQRKNIAFVTTDPVGRNLAGQVGIPVYQNAEGKELVAMPPRPDRPLAEETIEVDMSEQVKPEPPIAVHYYQGESDRRQVQTAGIDRPAKLRTRLLISIGAVLIATIGVLFLYPKTTVVLGVNSEPFASDIDLIIDKKATEANKNSSILPGTELAVEKEKTVTATATGKKTLGEKARGSVTVYNCYQSVPLSIASGTTMSSGGKSFVTTTAVTVPAAVIVGPNCTTAGQANINIEATEVGSDSNLASNSTFCVAGFSCSGGTYVNAKNATALQGGTSRTVTYLKQEDIDSASDAAKNELLSSATDELKAVANERKMRVLDAAIDAQVIEKKSDKSIEAETNDAQVTTKVRVRTLAFREADYRQLIVDLLFLRLPGGKRLILSEDDEITTTVPEMSWDEGYIKVKGKIKTRIADQINEDQVRRIVRNQSLSGAESQLKELPGIVEVKIETQPRLLNRTALFARNITIRQEAR